MKSTILLSHGLVLLTLTAMVHAQASANPTLTPVQRDTTLNFSVDGYCGDNFNEPIGRVSPLRAYGVTSNSFNLNQVSFVVERLLTAVERL